MGVVMNGKDPRWIGLSLALMLLSACTNPPAPIGSASKEPTQALPPIHTVMPSALPTQVPAQTATLPPEPFSTGTSLMAPTPEFGQGALNADFVFGGKTPTCQLPCWHNLKVGASTVEEVQKVFAATLGFKEMPNPQTFTDIGGYHISWNNWDLSHGKYAGGPEFFHINVLLDDSLRKLEAIGLSGSSYRFENYTSPERFFRELGQPSLMLISNLNLSEVPKEGSASLVLVYNSGIVVSYPFHMFIENDGVHAGGKVSVCLGHLPVGTSPYRINVDIIQPTGNDWTLMSPIQRSVISHNFDTADFQSFTSMSGVTLSEIAESAKENSNPCFSIQVP